MISKQTVNSHISKGVCKRIDGFGPWKDPGSRDQQDWVYNLETEISFHSVLILTLRPRLLFSMKSKTKAQTFFRVSTIRLRSRLFLSSLEMETGTETDFSLEIFSRYLEMWTSRILFSELGSKLIV